MIRHSIIRISALVFLLMATAARGQDAKSPKEVIQRAVDRVGGAAALRSVRVVKTTFVQNAFTLGQEEWPDAPAPGSGNLSGDEIRDFASDALVTHYQISGFPFAFHRVVTQDSAVVFRDTFRLSLARPPGNPVDAIAGRSWVQVVLRALDAPPDSLRAVPTQRIAGRKSRGIELSPGTDSSIVLWLADDDFTLTGITTVRPDPVLGRREEVVAFSNWTPVGSVRLPWTIQSSWNGRLRTLLTISAAEVNPATLDTLFSVRKLVMRRPSAAVTVEDVAPGIVRLKGSTHAPMAVVQGDSIILTEAPASPEFMGAVFDTLRSRFPGKAVKAFMVSHHHWDHVSGVQAAFDAGLRAITATELVEFVRGVGVPDSRTARARRITAVQDSMVVGDGPTRFVIYRVPTAHAMGVTMAYFPAHRLIAEVDLAAGPPSDRLDFYRFAKAHGLEGSRLSRIHGPIMQWEAFVKTLP